MLTLSNTDDIIMERVRQSDALGEVSERFKEPVLKTGDPGRDRGFESHPLRIIKRQMEN